MEYIKIKTSKGLLTLSAPNIKVGCYSFNLPPVKTCRPNILCKKYCYAFKAIRCYPMTKKCWDNNLRILKGINPNEFVDAMVKTLNENKIKYLRLHSSGDFYSLIYFLAWNEIARKTKCKIYAYTKRDDLLVKKFLIKRASNFIVYFSQDGIQSGKEIIDFKNYDGLSIVTDKKTNCKFQKVKGTKCMVNCFKCSKKNQILFLKKH